MEIGTGMNLFFFLRHQLVPTVCLEKFAEYISKKISSFTFIEEKSAFEWSLIHFRLGLLALVVI